METGKKPEPVPRRRWPRWLAWGISGLLVIHMLLPLGVRLWKKLLLAEDAPRIAFCPNDTWLEQLHVNEAYQLAFTLAQGELVEVQPGDVDPTRVKAWLKENRIDGLLLTGGGDVDPKLYGGDQKQAADVNAARDALELALLDAAHERGLPVLGICRGCQLLNVSRGGTLLNLRGDAKLEKVHFNVAGHTADVQQGSRLASIMDEGRLDNVQSFHYQAVDKVGKGLRVSATGPGGVVEAIEGTGPGWVLAVQWHPELSVNDTRQDALIKAFVEAARNRAQD